MSVLFVIFVPVDEGLSEIFDKTNSETEDQQTVEKSEEPEKCETVGETSNQTDPFLTHKEEDTDRADTKVTTANKSSPITETDRLKRNGKTVKTPLLKDQDIKGKFSFILLEFEYCKLMGIITSKKFYSGQYYV